MDSEARRLGARPGTAVHKLYLAIALSAAAAHAELYKYVDSNGHVIFTNIAPAGEQASPGSARESASAPHAKTQPPKANSSAPLAFPKVDAATQKNRDALRRHVLEDELRSEQELLKAAGVKGNREEVDIHRRNISAIQQELAIIKP
jgi:Domain of unknown function (DUF4124)